MNLRNAPSSQPTRLELTVLQLPPLSLYVHLPWCVRKCPYCDFNSHAAPAQIPQAQYVDALTADLESQLAFVQGRQLISIFFGGGTPSLFDPEQIGRILERARKSIGFAADIEITLEANPGTIEHGRFSGYREAGVNRVSLGAQTFAPEQLRLLGRIHGAQDTARAVDEIVAAGLDNFNLDLMYGLPAQSIEQALADLRTALQLRPTHLSHYQLTLEPGTVFYHRPPPLPDADEIWEMQLQCQELLDREGYAQYEVSAYARSGRRSKHNTNYWQFGDYLGIGAGAHGKLTLLNEQQTIVRTARCKQPREYMSSMAAAPHSEHSEVAVGDRAFEFMLNALRMNEGFASAAFEQRTGLGFASLREPLANAVARGLLAETAPGFWQPTSSGRRFLNDLQELFLP